MEDHHRHVAAAEDCPSTPSQDAATEMGMQGAHTTNAYLVTGSYLSPILVESILQILCATAGCQVEGKSRVRKNVLLAVYTLSVQMGLAGSIGLVQETMEVRYKLRSI